MSLVSTLVVSDIHLADAEPPHPHNPLWKRFKRPAHFVDRTFRSWLHKMLEELSGELELIFNGDIFDFDSVMVIPKERLSSVTWLERMRGMGSEEWKSRFKLKTILDDHPIWLETVRDFILRGNTVVFVIGNHDMECHWPSVQQDILDRFGLPPGAQGRIRFCEWFYLSEGDTLIEHGNQYDPYCICSNPINPLIRKGSKTQVRVPFGNLAGRYMVNGMGLMNPHATSSFIKSSIAEYAVFYYRYVLRTQPALPWTWFWSAIATWVASVSEGLLPALSDPLTVEERVRSIADRSKATPSMVWALRELHVHPAIYNPIKVLRELWLDRALLLLLIVIGSFQFFSIFYTLFSASLSWFLVPLILMTPIFLFYARSVQSEVEQAQRNAFNMAPLAAKIAMVNRVVQGHTHLETHTRISGVELLNTGTWSAAYHDVECTQPFGRKCYALIRAPEPGAPRVAKLMEWKDHQSVPIPLT